MHCGFVVKVENLRPHSNADRLQVATFFGNDTIVDLNIKEGDIGVYFPVDLQLSEEYCEVNNLVRKKDEDGNNIGGFLDPEKRNIKAIKLRGEKSDGLFMPLISFSYCYDNNLEVLHDNVNIGDKVTVLNGHEICNKYIPKRQYKQGGYSNGNKTRHVKVDYAPLFAEHADTEQLAYNHGAFNWGDHIEISLKMHGTSQRTGYLPVLSGYKDSFWCKLKNIIKEAHFNFIGKPHKYFPEHDGKPIYTYGYVTGTRRVVLEDFEGVNSFYGSNAFREQHHNAFVGKLNKGETVYYEVVGFTHTGAPIMANANNEKVGKDFVKQYGKETVFSYGCSPAGTSDLYGYEVNGKLHLDETEPKQSDIYVYRMTMTNEDGDVVEYTPDFMRYRCEQMGVKFVQKFTDFIIDPEKQEYSDRTPGEIVQNIAEMYYDGPDPVGKTHIREGVVVRIVNRPKFAAYKHKNFSFKCAEGICKDTATAPDMEEAQEVMDDDT